MRDKIILAVSMTLALAALGGCVFLLGAGAAGAAAYYFYEGEMQTTFSKSPEKVSAAVVSALKKDFDYTVVSQKPLEVKAKMKDGTDVWVRMKYLSDSSTDIRVRVGIIGDKDLSALILHKTAKRLGLEQ